MEVIQKSTAFLTKRGVESPRLQSELLLAHLLGIPRLQLYLNFERQLHEDQLSALRELVRRRGEREPLQHLLGSANFCGLELKVSPAVLIPRPETELLALQAGQFLQQRAASTPARVLDLGTGSGCLAIFLAIKFPAAEIHAVDLSPDALEVARANAHTHQVAERVQFHLGHGFDPLPDQRFDLVVSNPPYIPTDEIETLQPEVRDHDPRTALDGGPDGLDVFRVLAEQAAHYLLPSGRLLAEFGDGQAEALRELFQQHGWVIEAILPDESQRLRMLIARRD